MHRRDKLRAEKILQDRLFERQRAGNVDIVWNHAVDEVLGDDTGVTGVRVAATDGSGTRDIAVSGVFIAVGHTPNTQIFEGQLDMKGGYIVVQVAASRATRPRPACPACSPRATSPITSTARRSPRPARAAWPRSTRTSTSSSWTPARTEHAPARRSDARAGGDRRADRATSPAAEWDALDPAGNPFLRHEFLEALEATGCVGGDTRLDAASSGAARRRAAGWSAPCPST